MLQELITTCLPAFQAESSALDARLKCLCRSCSATSPVYLNVVNMTGFRYGRPDFDYLQDRAHAPVDP
eukprot:9214689-Heterocapsa_arctica.AAC.1